MGMPGRMTTFAAASFTPGVGILLSPFPLSRQPVDKIAVLSPMQMQSPVSDVTFSFISFTLCISAAVSLPDNGSLAQEGCSKGYDDQGRVIVLADMCRIGNFIPGMTV